MKSNTIYKEEINRQVNGKTQQNQENQVKIQLSEEKDFGKSSSQREIREKIVNQNEPQDRKIIRKYLIIIPIVILIIIIICLILYLILSKNKKKPSPKENDNIKVNNDNHYYYFKATYQSKKGEQIKLFNPSSLGLNESEYYVFESSGNSTLRRLRYIESTNGAIIGDEDGFIKIQINFTNPLPNLDFMFEGCQDLINIDLSNINSPLINSSIYTFTNCKNLIKVDFSSVDTSRVTTMDFLFAGCQKLTEIKGFENLNTSSVTKTAGMFIECRNLIDLNLSAFVLDNIKEQSGMFIDNPSLKSIDIGNCTDVTQLFSIEDNYNIRIYSTNNNINMTGINGTFSFAFRYEYVETNCTIGEGDLCKECNNLKGRKNLCGSCNEGYYLPKGIYYNPNKCLKNDEGCNDCYADDETDLCNCTSCRDGYKLFFGKCIKDCEIGEKDKCYDCNIENGTNDQCLNCNEGYYFDINYNKSKCKPIEINNCANAILESGILICLNCTKGYMLQYNNCSKTCEMGENEKCLSCNMSYEFRENCDSCNSGYYLDIEKNKSECQICPMKNLTSFCKECDIYSGEIKCIECIEGFELINNICFKSCDKNCLNCYFDGIHNGTCLQCKEEFYLKSNFILEQNNIYYKEQYCGKCPFGCSNCSDQYIGHTPISINCSSCIPGFKLFNAMCEKQCDVGKNNLCLTCDNEIKNRCASCNPGYYLDLFNGICISCGVENCAQCNKTGTCNKCIYQYEILNNICYKTCEIGENEKCLECDNSLLRITQNCSKCNEGYFLPNNSQNNTICVSCEYGCAECYGSLNESICRICKKEYQFINGECIKKCKLGLGELCHTCDYGDNEQNCLTCNEGYFLPNNISDRKKCKICGPYMKKCHEENNELIPDECYYPYKISGRYCLRNCIIGNGIYCSSCVNLPEKINQCKNCNDGYFLATDSDKTKCYSCEKGCKYCFGTKENNICTECYSNYKLFQGKCIKNCYTYNSYYYCHTCNIEPGKNDRCQTCNEGYFLPVYSFDIYKNKRCQNCPSDCINCVGLNDSQINCTKCNLGYYLAKVKGVDKEIYRCYKCSIPGCISCEGDSNSNICTKCDNEDPYIINGKIISCYKDCVIGENEKCKFCQKGTKECWGCNEDYIKYMGNCTLDFHFKATYRTAYKNEYVKLMKPIQISKMKINGTNIKNPNNYYIFKNPGEHIIMVKLANTNVFSHLFTDIKHLITIEFLDISRSAYINYMNDCFSGCTNLVSIDMTKLNLNSNRCFMNFFENDKNLKEVKFPDIPFYNIVWFYRMFYGCESLTSIDMSLVSNANGQYFYEMFSGCKNLKSINLSSFNYPYNGKYKYNMLLGVPKNISIIIPTSFYNSIQAQLINFTDVIKI